jgi:GTP-binding protein
VLVLLTKADKLASGARKAQVNMVREAVLALMAMCRLKRSPR